MDSPLLNSYLDLMESKRELEARIEEMKPEIVKVMEKAHVDEVTIGERGTITMSVRRTYKYPPTVAKLETDLKLAKVEAEAKGEATYTETRYPVFKSSKK